MVLIPVWLCNGSVDTAVRSTGGAWKGLQEWAFELVPGITQIKTVMAPVSMELTMELEKQTTGKKSTAKEIIIKCNKYCGTNK